MLGFPDQPFAFLTTFWMGVERGFNGYKHNSVRYAAAVKCPVLLQWGSRDNFVLKEETDAIYEALASKNKREVVYMGAFHESFLRKDPMKWEMETDRFLMENSH
jgi:alpha-beta hydrolase superfamily lysophospholipase